MKTAIQVSLLLFVLSVHGEEVCTDKELGFNICQDSGVLTTISKTGDNEDLSMLLDIDITIGPKTFKDLDITELKLRFETENEFNRSSFHTLTVGPESFIGLPNLKILTVQVANITVNGNPLAPLQKLERLILQTCDVDEVPTEMLVSTPHLEELSFEENCMSAIRPNAFAHLKKLKDLDLSKNMITTLEPGSFYGLDELRRLDLSLNDFKSVPAAFSGLNKLERLSINYCFELSEIGPDALKGMPALTTLELVYNTFRTLQPGTFDDLPKLRALRLNGNNIENIPKDVFNKLESLEELVLAFNFIKTMEPGAFSGLNLKTLPLAYNPDMKTIEPGVFDNATVEYLDLASCGISEIKPRAFSGLTTDILDLSRNELTKIDNEDFSGLSTRVIDLTHNNIAEIMPDAMKNTEVKSIDIGGNPVEIGDKGKLGLAESVEIRQ